MTFHQFLLIIRSRYKIVVSILLFTVITTLVISLLLPKQYTANTSVVVDVKSPDPIAGMVLPGLASPAYMATQIDIINSERVAERVVKMLRMDENAAIKEQWMDDGGKGSLTIWLVNLLKKKLDVKPSRESNVINIEYTGVDPDFAAAIANAFAQAYIDVTLGLKVAPARQYAEWFQDQTKIARDELERAKSALSAHQQKTGIVATDERLDYEIGKLNDLSAQLTLIQGQTSESSSKRKAVENPETLPEVIQNPLINSLKSDIARLDAKLQESNIYLGPNHPQTKRMQSELASLRGRLAIEIKKIHTSMDTSYEAGKRKEQEILESMEKQKERVLDLNKQRDQIGVLLGDVEAAQRNLEAISLRSNQSRLESLSVQTNVVTLNPASVPTEHSRPKIVLNVLIAIFLGTLLGMGVALMLEWGNRRIRSSEDLITAVDLPVLAVISSRRPRSLPKQLGTSAT